MLSNWHNHFKDQDEIRWCDESVSEMNLEDCRRFIQHLDALVAALKEEVNRLKVYEPVGREYW